MLKTYMEYLCCPACKADLSMLEQSLLCTACRSHYDIVNGIPILVDLRNLPTHLSQQITYFENESSNNTLIEDYKLKEWQSNYVERFRSNFNQIDNRLIVDCGAGSGYMAIELARIGAIIIACDLTLKSLQRLKLLVEREKIADRFIIVCCSAESLPFHGRIADYFISNAVLEHLPNEEKAIKEINRVCTMDAGLMVTVPLRYKYLNPLLIPINYIHDKRIGHLRRYDERLLLGKFQNWHKLQTYYTGHFVKVMKTLVNLVINYFDELKIERDDRKKEKNRCWASNIIVLLKRNAE